jgi:steroid 5-alpha reductase family enzyme
MVQRMRRGRGRRSDTRRGVISLAFVSALEWVWWIAGVASAFTWVASLVSGDTSWVDRSWSILPEVYVWVFAAHAHFENARLTTLAILTTIWGVRLTYNLARKGGYSGVEDYRWQVLRKAMPHWQFQLFNLFFIVLYQNALLVLIALPALSAYQHRSTPFGYPDVFATVVFVALLAGETLADQQQWRFHQEKKHLAAVGHSVTPGFLREGLFRYSRHPNYFFEIAQWWIVFAFGALAARSLTQWTVLGAALLTLLFVGSTRFTEKISSGKYPQYRDYQRQVSAIVPWRTRRSLESAAPDAARAPST